MWTCRSGLTERDGDADGRLDKPGTVSAMGTGMELSWSCGAPSSVANRTPGAVPAHAVPIRQQ